MPTRLLLLVFSVLCAARPLYAGELYHRYIKGILYSTPHKIVYQTEGHTTSFFETTYDIQTFTADPRLGIYAIAASTPKSALFYLFDIRGLYGAILSRKRIVSGKGVFRFEELTLSPDARVLRRKDGSVDHYEVTYYDVPERTLLKTPPPESLWEPGPWMRETFNTLAYREPGKSTNKYSITLSSSIADIRLFPDRNEALLFFHNGKPPAIYTLNPFQPITLYTRALNRELRRNRIIDWCPGGNCLLLAGKQGPHLFYPGADKRYPIPHIGKSCDDLRSQHASASAMLIECRTNGTYTGVLAEIPVRPEGPAFEKIPVENPSQIYYQWEGPKTQTWLTANLNQILDKTRKDDAKRAAQASLEIQRLHRLDQAEKALQKQHALDEEHRAEKSANSVTGQIAALIHIGLLGTVALRLRRPTRKNKPAQQA